MEAAMSTQRISIIKIRDTLMVTLPPDPDDATISALQDKTLRAIERHGSRSLIFDISAVETLDSFFARTISDTAQMSALMGGRSTIVGMRPAVAITATQLGLTLSHVDTALTLDRALDQTGATTSKRPRL